MAQNDQCVMGIALSHSYGGTQISPPDPLHGPYPASVTQAWKAGGVCKRSSDDPHLAQTFLKRILCSCIEIVPKRCGTARQLEATTEVFRKSCES